jgi:ABC-2 type transport system ATP-binding protein
MTVAVTGLDAVANWGVRGLVVRYGHHVALEGVDLEVPAGSVTAVVGADGAGKSSLLRALAGAVRHEAGEVRRPDRRHLGYVSTDRSVYRDLTVAENLSFAGEAYGIRGAELEARIDATLSRIGLAGVERRLAGVLSGGMRQKLALAMALLHDPALLVLDEPTTGIDPLSRVELWELISEIAAAGTAVVLATTYVDEAERAARVLVLADGRQLLAGAPEEIVAEMPGSIWAADRPLDGSSWRCGSSWRTWIEGDGDAAKVSAETVGAAAVGATAVGAAGARRVEPDLEDALVVAELQAVGHERTPDPHVSPFSVAPAHTDAGAPMIAVRRLGRRFGPLQALEDVDLDVRPGEVVGLIGANGAGKTTLIRIALGLLRPTAGTAELFGELPSRESRARVGYMSQGLGLYEDLTVGENLAFVSRSFGMAESPRLEPKLATVRDRLVGELSLGLRRRVAFAATLSHRPDLIVLDEPTSGVGALARARLWELIRSAAEDGAGVLVTTHYMAEASQCDRLVVLLSGRVAALGTADQIAHGLVAIEVVAEAWDRPFHVLRAAGFPVALAGRRIRIPGGEAGAVRAALGAAGLSAELRQSPATFEEAFVLLARGTGVAMDAG